MESDSSEDDFIVRGPRVFKNRICYRAMQETNEFNERFRMDFETFSYVLNEISVDLQHPTNRNKALSPTQQLQIALHWFGSGAQYNAIGDMHGVSKATVCRSVKKVVRAVNQHLLNRHVQWPDDVGAVINEFSAVANMPRATDIVDGTLIKMDGPTDFEPIYVDRHGNHSINARVVCGPDLQFYYANANWPGSTGDARVLRNSGLAHRMEGGWRPFPGGVLLGDSIYPLKRWLIPPVVNDVGHKKTRRLVECALGILKEKFSCLNYLRLEPEFVRELFLCCVTLCNLTKAEGYNLNFEENGDDDEGIVEAEEDIVNEGGQEVLNYFYQHFVN